MSGIEPGEPGRRTLGRPSRETLIRLAASLGLLGLLTIPVILLVENEFDSAGVRQLSSPAVNLAPPKDDYYGVPSTVYNATDYGMLADLCVTFEFLDLDPSGPDVRLGVLVGATSEGKQDLAVEESAFGYKDVSLVVKSNSGLSNFMAPIPISALEAARASGCGARPRQADLDQFAGYRANWTVSLLGQPRAFPQDWYELDDSVTVVAGNAENGTALPSSLVLMSRDEDLRVTVQIDRPPSRHSPFVYLPDLSAGDRMVFTVHRPPLIVTYTYWVAAMPFVLLTVLLWFKRIVRREPLEATDIAFGVAATMVAILPLRTVLVPSTVPGLTRLDLFFGLGITFLVASSIMWVVVWLPRLAPSSGAGAGDDDEAIPGAGSGPAAQET